ncbi:hypothetical protein DRN73_03130 [Candidatus Pacearchaeota archaeon]|nr:MAG: hypothetical protein DRN73_03130 [Candidatus Pacearchaeota archaeon]
MKKIIFLFFILFLIESISAASINYQIFENKVLVQEDFGEVRNFELKLPYDTDVFETDSDYILLPQEEYKLLKVNFSKNLNFSYITSSMIEKSKNKYFFIMKNNFNEKQDIKLFLPEAGALMKDKSLIFPKTENISTDGRRIILEWKNFNDEEIVVAYEIIKNSENFWFYILIILIGIFAILYTFQLIKSKKKLEKWKEKIKKQKKKIKEKTKKELTKNLFKEEKEIIEYLMEKKGNESWTKEIVRDLGISKVRLSRKLRNLEQKELIEKIPFGNENKIKLLKTQ